MTLLAISWGSYYYLTFTNKPLGKGVLSKEPSLKWHAFQSACSELHATLLPHLVMVLVKFLKLR